MFVVSIPRKVTVCGEGYVPAIGVADTAGVLGCGGRVFDKTMANGLLFPVADMLPGVKCSLILIVYDPAATVFGTVHV